MARISNRESASPIWLTLSLLSFLASLVLAVLPVLRVISNTSPLSSVLGWLLTPVATFVFFGIDDNVQKRGGSNFIRKPAFTRTLQVIAILSVGLLVPHAIRLASLWSVVNS